MKKRVMLIITAIFFVAVIAILIRNKDGIKNVTSGTEKNIGLSHVEINLNIGENNEFVFDVKKYVPDQNVLIDNLEKKGYKVTTENTELSPDITGVRITAKKSDKFCVIVYGLDIKQAIAVFPAFEEEYREKEFYVLAQNEQYVYCVSDPDTFEEAGFTGLGNNGTQYINY